MGDGVGKRHFGKKQSPNTAGNLSLESDFPLKLTLGW